MSRLADMKGRFARQSERIGANPTAENIEFLDEGENLFAQSVDEGHGRDPRARRIFLLCVALVALYAFGCVVPKNMFNWQLITSTANTVGHEYTLSWFIGDLQDNVAAIIGVFAGRDPELDGYLSTMLRYVVIAFAGAGLALSGAVYQGAFKNALVSPSTLGVMSGGQFGMMLWVLIAVSTGQSVSLALAHSGENGSATLFDYLSSSYGLAIMSFIGCLLVVGLVLFTMRLAGARKLSGIMMIITGQVIGGVIGVIKGLVTYYFMTVDPYGDAAQLLQELQVASFYRIFGLFDIVAVGIPLVVTFVVVYVLRQRMMLLAFDETEQRTLGVDTRKMQIIVVGLCTLVTAIVISFCGTVGFVGFLVPHMARRLVGPDFKYLLPASLVIGSLFVLGAYLAVEMTLGYTYTTMTGMYISIFGSIVFLWTALKGGGVGDGTFK